MCIIGTEKKIWEINIVFLKFKKNYKPTYLRSSKVSRKKTIKSHMMHILISDKEQVLKSAKGK